MAAVMTPVNNNVGRKSLGPARGGNIPLFTSPRTRKSTGQPGLRLTPSGNRESLADSDQQASLLNNDEEELRERQRQRAAELQQQNMASPSTPADRRKSMGPATGMTNAAIVEHYSNCIKLSAENKINMKNAFNLQLIDCMSEMLRKKDPEMNNFQAASCTLDASTKIYAYRVDCVHNDTLKMAGGLGRTGEAQEEEGAAGANPDGEDPENASKAKKKSKRKPKKTIENNVDSLNLSKFDLEYEVDPLFKKNCSMFDEGRNGGVNFLTSLMLKDDDCQLVLDTDSMSNSKSNDPKEIQQQSTCLISILHGLDSTDVCPTLREFNFTNWDPEDEDLMGGPKSPTKRKLDDVMNNLPLHNDDHAFDMDAVPDLGAADESDDEIHQGMDDVEEEVEVGMDRRGRGMGHDEQPILAGPGRRELNVVELKDQLSTMPLEYSYFGPTARSAWAGPLHWMIPRGPKHGIEQAKQGDPNKKKRRKNALVLDFESIPEFGNEFAPARGVSKLTHGTLLQWLTEKITLPEDLHFDIKEFTQSFTRPLLSVRPVGNREDPVAAQNVEGMPYDYENRRDAENFCPVLEDDGGDHLNHSDGEDDAGGTMMTFDDPTADFGSQADATKMAFASQFTGDNLIAAPNMVAKIQINYARVAKKMDMRRLKSTMWSMINHRKEDATPENPKAFSQVYHQIPGLLPEKMAENLSVSLAFAALLHLVNENNLQLQQTYGYLEDFTVVHPK